MTSKNSITEELKGYYCKKCGIAMSKAEYEGHLEANPEHDKMEAIFK